MKPAMHKYANGGVVKVKVKKAPMKPHVPAEIKDPIPKSKHKLKRVPKPTSP